MPKRSSKAAENPRRGWRENLREFVIVVAGVFVALVAQQAVDAWNWHRKIQAAEDAMRWELLADDGPEVYQRAAMHPCAVASLDSIRSAVLSGATRQDIAHRIGGYWVGINGYDQQALDAANASDVSSHMTSDELQKFRIPYEVIPLLQKASDNERDEIALLHAFRGSGGAVSDEEKDRLLEAVELLRKDDDLFWRFSRMLTRLRTIGPLDAERVGVLMASAQTHYGTCVKPLPADFPAGIAF